MRCSNDPIARQANKEDGCKGKFFESRFVSQALLDEVALLTCSVYVDLNPVRAGIADTPEESDYTSIKKRIDSYQKNEITNGLFPFAGNPREPMPMGIPCTAEDYFDLVDMTAREQCHGFSSTTVLKYRIGICACRGNSLNEPIARTANKKMTAQENSSKEDSRARVC